MSNLVKTTDMRHAIEMDPKHQMFGWVFFRGPETGQWVSDHKASDETIIFCSVLMNRLKVISEGVEDHHGK
jgi:hypothetical protein